MKLVIKISRSYLVKIEMELSNTITLVFFSTLEILSRGIRILVSFPKIVLSLKYE